MDSSAACKKRKKAASAGLVLVISLVIVILLSLASLIYGSVSIPFSSFLTGRFSQTDWSILVHLRIPRMLASLLAGSALAAAGWLIQSVLANPLAAPNIIGIHSGAGLFVTLACALAPQVFGSVPIAAFLGAMASSFLVLFMASRLRAGKMSVILGGLAISQIFSAFTDLLITLYPDALSGYTDFRIGSLAGLSMPQVFSGALLILPVLLLCLLCAPELEILQMGEENAGSLGLSSHKWMIIFLVFASLLSGGAISFGGLIGFIGLIVPQISKRLLPSGCSSRAMMMETILCGAIVLLLSDLLARILFAPYEIPCGIILALAGGPYFLFLLIRKRKKPAAGRRKKHRKAGGIHD